MVPGQYKRPDAATKDNLGGTLRCNDDRFGIPWLINCDGTE